MKNKLALATLFLSTAIVAASCDNDVTIKKDKESDKEYIIFSINGEKYHANDLLEDMQDSASATSTLYNEVARKVFTAYAEQDEEFLKKKASIESDANDKVNDFKDDCKTAAKENSKDYDEYLEEQLTTLGVETINELRELYYYQGLKEEIEEDFVEDHYAYFLNQYLTTYTPFQVKHILVAANSNDSLYATGTMSTDNARKLLSIMNKFVEGETFANVAKITDDTSSSANGGVMPFNQAQNYVSEFRFATYAQEIFANNKTKEDRYKVACDLHVVNGDETSSDYVSLDEFVDSNLYKIYDSGFGTVKISDIFKLNGDVTAAMKGSENYFNADGTIKEGLETSDVPTIAEQKYESNISKFNYDGTKNEKYYEEYELTRNEIFNSTLNSHKVQFIELDGEYANISNKTTVNGKTVLADELGNPIFVAIASTGIHFMSMVWNSYNYAGTGITTPKLQTGALDSLKTINSDLNQAYFTLFESGSNIDLTKYQYTYIGRNGAYATKSGLQSASDSLLSDITSYVSNVEYYLFNSLVNGYETKEGLTTSASKKYDVSFATDSSDKKTWNAVKEYVTKKLTSTDESFASEVQSSAKTYGEKLAREAEVKEAAKNWKK